jgi:hypothetical protein
MSYRNAIQDMHDYYDRRTEELVSVLEGLQFEQIIDVNISLTNNIPQEILNQTVEPQLTTNSSKNTKKYINTLIRQYCLKLNIKNKDYAETETCVICQEKYIKNNTVLLLPCNHAFHITCAKEWFKRNTNCPVCRNHIIDKNNSIEKLRKCTNITEVDKTFTDRIILINKKKEHIRKITKKEKNSQNKKKNKICRNFRKDGNCRFGNKCQFSHSI